MKILYLSCHSILEYDELKLFTELGYEVYSHGAYRDPRGAYTLPRPGIEGMKVDEDWIAKTAVTPKTALTPDMIDPFDIIIVMSGEQEAALINNWPNIKHKRVILRTIGQSTPNTEFSIQRMRKEGLQIVRYSPKEINIPNFAGIDASIRFYKDPEEFKDWNGKNAVPVNFTQTLRGRGKFVHYDEVMGAMAGFEGAKIYGSGNNDIGMFNGGEIPYDAMKQVLRDSRVYVYAGSWPASYTLSFIEALMTGIPVVVASKRITHNMDLEQFDFYEADELVKHEQNGFVCENVIQMRNCIERMLKDQENARIIGEKGRQTAIKEFSKEKIKEQWKNFLEKGGNNVNTN